MRSWQDPDSVESRLQDDAFTQEDRDLIQHVLLDDKAPPGLHRQGWKCCDPDEACEGDPGKCPFLYGWNLGPDGWEP